MKLRTKVVRRVGKPIIRARSRYATKYTLHVYAKKDRVLHWDLSDQNADTKEISNASQWMQQHR